MQNDVPLCRVLTRALLILPLPAVNPLSSRSFLTVSLGSTSVLVAILAGLFVFASCESKSSIPGLTLETELAGMYLGEEGWNRMMQRANTEDDAFTLRDLTIFDRRVTHVFYPADEMFAFDQSFGNVDAYGFNGEVYLASRGLQSPSVDTYKALRDSLIVRFGEPTVSVAPSRSDLLPADAPDGQDYMRRRFDYDSSDPDLRLQQSYVVEAWKSDSVRVILRRIESEIWRAPIGRKDDLMSLNRDEAVVDTSSQSVRLILEEDGGWPVDSWAQSEFPDALEPIPGTAKAKRFAFQERLDARLERAHPALDTLRFVGQLPLDGQKGDANYPIEQRSDIFSDRQYEVVDIDPATVRPFISDLERADLSYINAYFNADGSVSSVQITLRPASRYRSLSGLHRDALQLLAQRFGTPDVKYIDHDREKRGHLWYTDSKALDLILEDESVEIEITLLPGPTFFLQPDRYNL